MTQLPDKPRRHRWVTEALSSGDTKLSVWPSDDDLSTEKKRGRFLETIAKIGNDPRVMGISKHTHEEHNAVYVFDLREE